MTFFNENEVPECISSLVRVTTRVPEELSIESGTFRWATPGSTKSDAAVKASSPLPISDIDSGSGVNEAIATSVSTRPAIDQEGGQLFELKDINVRIPSGKLTVCLFMSYG